MDVEAETMAEAAMARGTGGPGDPLDLLRRALDQGARIVASVTPDQADLPTPCEGWTVRHLIEHMVGGLRFHTGIVTGAVGGGERPAPGSLPSVGDDWAAEYGQAREAMLAAWQHPGALAGTYHLPFGVLPGPAFTSASALEAVVHSWDLAKATGQLDLLDPALAEAVLGIAHRTLPAERPPDLPFKPVVTVPETAPAYDRLAAYVGRQP